MKHVPKQEQIDMLLAALWKVLADAENEIPLYLITDNGKQAYYAINTVEEQQKGIRQ